MDASLRVSLGRIIAQGLVPATAARSPLDAVENLAALQGQQASAIPWAIGVRCKGVSRARVEESFARGELVRSVTTIGCVGCCVTGVRAGNARRFLWASPMLSSNVRRRLRVTCWRRHPWE